MRHLHGNTRYTEEHRAKARRWFVENDKTPEQIAETLGCSTRTVQAWIREGEWRDARLSYLQIQGIPLEDLEERALRRLLSRLSDEADRLEPSELLELLSNVNRFKALIAKRQGYRLLDAALVVGDEFQAFVVRECPEEAPVILQGWKTFLDALQKRGSE